MPSINIKNEEAYKLARELAKERETSMTELVLDLLRKESKSQSKYDRAFDEKKFEYWRNAAKEIRASVDHPIRAADIDSLLYDERGLPK